MYLLLITEFNYNMYEFSKFLVKILVYDKILSFIKT